MPHAAGLRGRTNDAANLNLVYDRNQPTPVIDSGGNPIMLLGHVTEVDAAMPKRYGVFVALIGEFANELDRLARANLLVDIAAAIKYLRRFATELCNAGWLREIVRF